MRGRSFFTSQEERVLLLIRIDHARELTLAKGQPWILAEHPDVILDNPPKNRFSNPYSDPGCKFNAVVDKRPLSADLRDGVLFSMRVGDEQRNIGVTVYSFFNDQYSLAINFYECGLFYTTRIWPYNKMTDEEYRIMKYYLERYLQSGS